MYTESNTIQTWRSPVLSLYQDIATQTTRGWNGQSSVFYLTRQEQLSLLQMVIVKEKGHLYDNILCDNIFCDIF